MFFDDPRVCINYVFHHNLSTNRHPHGQQHPPNIQPFCLNDETCNLSPVHQEVPWVRSLRHLPGKEMEQVRMRSRHWMIMEEIAKATEGTVKQVEMRSSWADWGRRFKDGAVGSRNVFQLELFFLLALPSRRPLQENLEVPEGQLLPEDMNTDQYFMLEKHFNEPTSLLTLWPFSPGSPARPSKPLSPWWAQKNTKIQTHRDHEPLRITGRLRALGPVCPGIPLAPSAPERP